MCLWLGCCLLRLSRCINDFHERQGRKLVELSPISNSLIVWVALVVGALVALLFVTLYGRPLNINNDIGQVGDFIGGLINPVLSFLALLVLLRTMQIQTSEARKNDRLFGISAEDARA